MELDSPSSTPPQSPAHVPANPDSLINFVDVHSKSRPESTTNGLPVCSDHKNGENGQVSSAFGQHPPSAATRDEKIALRPINTPMGRTAPRGPTVLRSLTPATASSAQGPIHGGGSRDFFAPVQASIAGSLATAANATNRGEAVSLVSPVTSKPSVPAKRKPVVANPFVSGGFMTEFVGPSGPAKIPEPIKLPTGITATPQRSLVKVGVGYSLLSPSPRF
jgi:hypothetical protein